MIFQGLCSVFKTHLLSGLEDFTASSPYTYKMALYTANANLDAATLAYTPLNEITGLGYSAGGSVVVPTEPDSLEGIAYLSFVNIDWNPAYFLARGALIYNATTNAAVCLLDFGSDKIAANRFPLIFPPATAETALIRLL